MNILFFKDFATLLKQFSCLCFQIAGGSGLQNQTCDVFEFRFLNLRCGIQGVLDLLKHLIELITSKSLLSFILVAESAAPEFYPGHVNMDHFSNILFCFKSSWWPWSFAIWKCSVVYPTSLSLDHVWDYALDINASILIISHQALIV